MCWALAYPSVYSSIYNISSVGLRVLEYILLFVFGFFFFLFSMYSPCRGIRFSVWNTHNVINKRADVEFLLHDQELDILCISESWLTEDDVFEFHVFYSLNDSSSTFLAAPGHWQKFRPGLPFGLEDWRGLDLCH